MATYLSVSKPLHKCPYCGLYFRGGWLQEHLQRRHPTELKKARSKTGRARKVQA